MPNKLTPGQRLFPGEKLTSSDGRTIFKHQEDGNVVVYHNKRPVWSTRTNGVETVRLEMQRDGNLVLYAPKKALWASHTNNNKGAELRIQNDGNVVIYNKGKALWATHTIISKSVIPIGGEFRFIERIYRHQNSPGAISMCYRLGNELFMIESQGPKENASASFRKLFSLNLDTGEKRIIKEYTTINNPEEGVFSATLELFAGVYSVSPGSVNSDVLSLRDNQIILKAGEGYGGTEHFPVIGNENKFYYITKDNAPVDWTLCFFDNGITGPVIIPTSGNEVSGASSFEDIAVLIRGEAGNPHSIEWYSLISGFSHPQRIDKGLDLQQACPYFSDNVYLYALSKNSIDVNLYGWFND